VLVLMKLDQSWKEAVQEWLQVQPTIIYPDVIRKLVDHRPKLCERYFAYVERSDISKYSAIIV
jgi:hypothetical protein